MTRHTMNDLLEIMSRLRDPDTGCPWDIGQTFETIAPYTIEESYEVAEAIAAEDRQALRDELGDLLFQVVFHAQMAKEEGSFTFDDVVDAVCEKMQRRHPHVFGDENIADADAQTKAWEAHKERERHEKAQASGAAPSVLDGVALSYPALMRSVKLSNRAARVGFDWPGAAPVIDKLREEMAELAEELVERSNRGQDKTAIEHEFGDVLFAWTSLARHLDIDPEHALREANRRFEQRFRNIERHLERKGERPEDQSLEQLETLWQRAKKEIAADDT